MLSRGLVRFYTSVVERKLATVLFVDLVGSTELVTGTDPEVVRRRVTRFFDEVTHCVTTHGGIVEKFAGDAVLAAFGVAQAHEDDAERAIRAGLGILEAVKGLELQARIGIESGEVVVDAADSTFATGEAVNLAARLQQAAAPGEILIGPAARSLALGPIEVEEAGTISTCKGAASRSQAWRVVCAADRAEPLALERRRAADRPRRRARPARATPSSAPPATGARTWSRSTASRAWGRAAWRASSSPASRARPSSAAAACPTARASPTGRWPRWSSPPPGISDDDPVKEAMEKLRMCCEDEAVADLLGLAAGVLEAVESRPQRPGDRLGGARVGRPARRRPAARARLRGHPLGGGAALRADRAPRHVGARGAAPDRLPRPARAARRPARLGRRPDARRRDRARPAAREPRASELIEALLARRDRLTPRPPASDLLDKTEGNPLFVEETVRMLAERRRLLPERIPDTLQALIAARIDRLPPRGEGAAPPRGGDRPHLLARRDRARRPRPRRRRADRRPPAPRLPARRAAVDDHRRARVPLQAHADPRGRVRRACPRPSAPSCTRASPSGCSERAGDELLEIRAYHLDQAALLHAELDGAPPAELAARGRRRARGGGPPRARARGEPLGPQAAAPRGRARADARAPLPRRARGLADDRPAGRLGRDGAGARRGARRGRRDDRGQGADRARRGRAAARRRPAEGDRADRRRARGASRRRGASPRSASAGTIAWWVGDFEMHGAVGRGGARDRPAASTGRTSRPRR